MRTTFREPRRKPIFLPIVVTVVIFGVSIYQIFNKPDERAQTASSSSQVREPALAPNEVNDFLTPTPTGADHLVEVGPEPAGALADALKNAKPGDYIQLADGVYNLDGLRLNASGKADQWIKIVAQNGANPKIDLNSKGEFQISGSYIYLEGIEIYNGQRSNLRIASSTHTLSNVVIRKVKLHSLSSGPGATLQLQRNNANGVGVKQVFIEDSDLSLSTTRSVVEAIGVHNVVLRNNFIHTDSGYAAGVTFKGGSSRILIENNFIKGVRRNPAIVLGGKTFLKFFDPQYQDQEGVDQLARNNIIVDFDDAAVSFQGVRNARFLHNTIVTTSNGPVFHFAEGNTNDGTKTSKNHNILISNNLVVSKSKGTVYAVNDSSTIDSLKFGSQMWIGTFANATTGRFSIPQFPLADDSTLPNSKAAIALRNLHWKGIDDLDSAIHSFSPKEKSPVVRSTASIAEAPYDFKGQSRSETASFGALEN